MRRTARSIGTLVATAAICMALSCSSPAPEAPPPLPPAAAPAAPAKAEPPRIVLAGLGQRIHDRINRERRKRGLATMRWDDALGRIAGRHSKDMASNGYFGHTSPQGHSYPFRYLKDGYACGVTVNGVLRRGAENIARISPTAGEDPAAAAVREWLQNAEDRKNLLSLPWERQGIGVSLGPDGLIYVTLNFC